MYMFTPNSLSTIYLFALVTQIFIYCPYPTILSEPVAALDEELNSGRDTEASHVSECTHQGRFHVSHEE